MMRHFSIKQSVWILACLTVCWISLHSCKEEVIETNEPEIPFNPYDTIDYSSNVMEEVPVDSSTFLGLHTYIFSQRCAVPACHDGSFEPDFRTVQSAYNSLVYHPPVKNTPDSFFTYRVHPGNVNKSWLHERITTDDPVLGRMPLYDNPLTDRQIGLIEDWIMDGAPDVWGNVPQYPDYRPATFGFLAYLPDVNNMRIDTINYKNVFYYPFYVPHNVNLKIYFGLFDTNEDGDFLLPTGFTYNKIKFSANKPYDFSNAVEVNMTKEFTPFMGPLKFAEVNGTIVDVPYFHHVTLNTGQFSSGDIVYMRMYVDDGQHAGPTEIPDSGAQVYFTTWFAFIVQ